jgi:hypothetical protein
LTQEWSEPWRRKDETHQISHNGKPECDEQPVPNNDIPYTQSHNKGKHTGLTVSIALSSHEAEEGQKQYNQMNEGDYTAVTDQLDAQVE